MRSKAVWGYDDAFMERCRPILRVDPGLVAEGLTAVVADEDDRPVAVAQLECEADPPLAEIDLFFVDPPFQGRGVGRVLFAWILDTVRDRGLGRIGILSDPGARPFYERMGAKFMKMAPSDAIAGRELPWLELDVAT